MVSRTRYGWRVSVAATFLVAACGADEPANDPLLSPDHQDALANGSAAPPAAALNRVMEIIVDPKVSAAEKFALVEDSDADRDVFTKIADQGTATYRFIAPTSLAEPNESAHANVEVHRTSAPVYRAEIPLIYDEGSWKIGKAAICPLLVTSSPMCQASP